MIEINGAHLEGGGQIVRTALALASITQQPCRIYNIRASRPNPGLRVQHLEGAKALAKLCNAELKGAFIGSTELYFRPNRLRGGKIEISVSTAGSVGLIFQILSLPAAFCETPVEVRVKGGATYGKFAPPADYIKLVLLPILKKMGYEAEIEIRRHGFYPKGGAEVEFRVEPVKKLKPLRLVEPGKLAEIKGVSVASMHLKEKRVAERQSKGALDELNKYKEFARIENLYTPSLNPGSGITLCAVFENAFIGADSLGERGKRAEMVGKECAGKLLQAVKSGACLDQFSADQVLPFLAAAGEGEITASRITKHALTNAWVIEKFLPVKFEFFGREGESGKIVCRKRI